MRVHRKAHQDKEIALVGIHSAGLHDDSTSTGLLVNIQAANTSSYRAEVGVARQCSIANDDGVCWIGGLDFNFNTGRARLNGSVQNLRSVRCQNLAYSICQTIF